MEMEMRWVRLGSEVNATNDVNIIVFFSRDCIMNQNVGRKSENAGRGKNNLFTQSSGPF